MAQPALGGTRTCSREGSDRTGSHQCFNYSGTIYIRQATNFLPKGREGSAIAAGYHLLWQTDVLVHAFVVFLGPILRRPIFTSLQDSYPFRQLVCYWEYGVVPLV